MPQRSVLTFPRLSVTIEPTAEVAPVAATITAQRTAGRLHMSKTQTANVAAAIMEKPHTPNQPQQADGPLPPRLTHLELHGYKTFADKTEFAFPGGITAIVGPNGSGKSNIADALRWVLGEQSYTLLRGKRTEDMIFSGSELRARMGMATVSVTFDNTSGWLPVDFSTVVISRRAYRSGENEYYLNGSRVRLRDIQELLAASGLLKRSYAIIGQGLVDQALSLRPEERRALIEEAAGITAYQRKRDQALTRLAEVEANLIRVRDILAEITPRLKRLKRQAERVQQYTLLEQELREHLITWYGYRWHKGLEDLEHARSARDMQEARLQERQRLILDLEKQLQHLREEQQHLRQESETRHSHIATLHREVETLLREEAVAGERKRGLEAQRETLLSELPALEAHLQILAERLRDAEAQQALIEEEAATLHDELAQARAALAEVEAQRQAAAQAVQTARERALTLTTQIAQLEEQRHQVHTRLQHLNQEIAAQAQQLTELKARRQQAQAALDAQRKQRQALENELAQLSTQIAEQEQALQRLQEDLLRAREEAQQAEAAHRRLQERFDLLERLREEGSGLYAGVRAVLRATHLKGIIGVVAEILHVPPHLERAVEEALGSSLQDIVVERWQDAEAAIAYLKRERAGRATFLPLDTIRPPKRVAAPRGNGIVGLAADLVDVESRLRPVAELLLNRTLIVEDLPTARRVLPQANGMRIVTLAGELVRSSGRVTGGEGRQTRGGVLAREREWRELPARIAKAEDLLRKAQAAVTEREQALVDARAALAALRQRHTTLARRLEQARREERRREADLAAVDGQLQAQNTVRERLEQEATDLAQQQATLESQLAQLEEEKVGAEEALMAAEAQLHQVDDSEARARLAHLESVQAGLEGRRQSVAATITTLREDMERQRRLLAERQERLHTLEDDLSRLDADLAHIRERLTQTQARLEALETPVREAEERLRALQQEQQELTERLEQERQRLHQEESHLARLELTVQRAEDTLHHLRHQMEEDLGLIHLEEQSDLFPAQVPLPLGNGVATLPKVTQIPAALEEDIKRLRIQLRNLGPINPDAPQEYEQLRQRHDFLEEQIQDLTEASEDLKQALDELDRIMRQEFKRTFQAVAREFKTYFHRLFGGGTARLTLTNPDDLGTTGIDIIARPPGKRTQGLAMLSGGERALTAAALIFAILRVSPPPFCILDEVDAALDEANVGRFREVLKELSREIQFIIITHNRGTIEVADTIYGISMGRDGVSKVLSLRLEEVDVAA